MNDYTKLIILASTSPRRRELILRLGLPVKIIDNQVDETITTPLSPEETVEVLSRRKAEAAFESYKEKNVNGVIVAADTVVVLDDHILGKPADEEAAFRMLKGLSGRIHKVYTGVTCIDIVSGEIDTTHQRTAVTMKTLDDVNIHAYIKSGEPMDKAGAYGIQGLGAAIIEGIEGDYFNVVGLPLALLVDMLRRFGIDVLT